MAAAGAGCSDARLHGRARDAVRRAAAHHRGAAAIIVVVPVVVRHDVEAHGRDRVARSMIVVRASHNYPRAYY